MMKDKITEMVDKLRNLLPPASNIVPVLSGGAVLFLLNKLIESNLEVGRLVTFLVVLCIIFLASAFLFGYLKKIEKDKDQYLLSTVGKIIEDVFKHYGVAMASNDAGQTAKEMNPIMQTIVNLVKELKELAQKGYLKG